MNNLWSSLAWRYFFKNKGRGQEKEQRGTRKYSGAFNHHPGLQQSRQEVLRDKRDWSLFSALIVGADNSDIRPWRNLERHAVENRLALYPKRIPSMATCPVNLMRADPVYGRTTQSHRDLCNHSCCQSLLDMQLLLCLNFLFTDNAS